MIALEPLILKRLGEGITIRQIWLELHGEGKVTVAQRNFYVQVNNLTQAKPSNTKPAGRDLAGVRAVPAPVTVARSEPPQGDLLANDLKRTFSHSKRPDADELW